MRLIDIVNAPWAITTDMLLEIQGIYSRHVRGEKINLANIEAAIGRPLDNKPKGYEIQNGVALLPVDGVIAKRMNLFSRISGGCSTEMVGQEFDRAMSDPDVKSIILLVDSPGGTVDGTPELAAKVFAAREQGKKCIAFCDGMIASAAYWIGSACSEIYISSEVVICGSIGVVTSHVDVSKAEEQAGYKTTEIYSGKYKRIASQHGPLTEEGRAVIQEQLDHVYSVFVDDVSKHRGVSADVVLAQMADGRIFQGSQAVTAGLVDGVSTLADCIASLQNQQKTTSYINYRGAGAAAANQKEKTAMTLDQFKAEHPEICEALAAEATAGHAEALTTARAEGAASERDRIVAVRATALPGHEALIETMAFDGTSTAADAALAIVAAENKMRGTNLKVLESEAPPVVPVVADEQGSVKTIKRADFNALPLVEQRAAISAKTKIIE